MVASLLVMRESALGAVRSNNNVVAALEHWGRNAFK